MQKFAPAEHHDQEDSAAGAAARRRLLQYLQALHYPVAEAERLVDQALLRARADHQPSALLPAALAALQDLLPPQPPLQMPPPRRQPMVPEPLDRSLLQFMREDMLTMPLKAARRLLRRLPWLGVCGVLLIAGYQQFG